MRHVSRVVVLVSILAGAGGCTTTRDWTYRAPDWALGRQSLGHVAVLPLRYVETSFKAREKALFVVEQVEKGLAALPGSVRDPVHVRPTIAGVRARRELALRVKQTTDAEQKAWDEACAFVAASPRYQGYDLRRVEHEGLVSLGRDPESGLLEAWHVASGDRPRRGPDERLELTDGTGLVLVLVPGGKFQMGSPPGRGRDDEHERHEVRVKPFFVSKYELTQGQWLRATGSAGSTSRPVSSGRGRRTSPSSARAFRRTTALRTEAS